MTTFGQQNFTETAALKFFLASFSILLFVQFPISAPVVTTLIFYIAIAPSLIVFLFYKRKNTFDIIKENKILAIWCIYFAAIIIHTIFFSAPSQPTFKILKQTLFTFVFFLSSTVFFVKMPRDTLMKLFYAIGVIAGISALTSILIHYNLYQDFNNRLKPIGRANHETLGSLLYTIAAMLGLYSINKTNAVNRYKRLSIYIAVLLIGTMVVLTRSRMPMILFFSYVPIVILWTQPRHLIFTATVIMASLCLSFYALLPESSSAFIKEMSSYFDGLASRGTAYRNELWSLTISEIQKAPIFGNGMYAKLNHSESHSVHNLYLSHAYHMGFYGLIAFLICIAYTGINTLRIAIKRLNNSFLTLSLLYICLLSGLTEFSQPVKSPSPMWFIIWMPIGWAVGLSILEHKSQQRVPQKMKPSA